MFGTCLVNYCCSEVNASMGRGLFARAAARGEGRESAGLLRGKLGPKIRRRMLLLGQISG